MPRPKTPRARLEAAKAAVAKGTSQAESASRHRVSLRTLERALGESRKGKKPAARGKIDAKRSPARATTDRARDVVDEDAPLLQTLLGELRNARRDRRNLDNSDAENRAWSKTIRELVSAIERIAPPPPPPPDEIQAELRRLDAITIELIEQFLAEPIKPEEITG